jgi:uncharacterized protein (TIGR02678 family)
MNDAAAVAEARDAARALLVTPIVDRGDPQALALARRRRAELARLFADELGYRLDASRPTLVRLAKAAGPGHVPRGLATRGGRRFDRRRYALVCLVLGVLEREGERTTAARLFREVATRAADVEGLAFSTEVAADRRAFVQAVQAVVDMGVLELAEGDEERFARGQEGGDALYRVDRDRLGLLPAVVVPPSLADSPESVLAEPYPDTEEGRVRRRRHRVMRALVEQPVVYAGDLEPDEVDYLTRQRGRIERVLAEHFGLTLEVRAEGWVAVDPDAELTDLRWPDYGTAETTALRLCDELRARRLRGDPERWPEAEVVGFAAGLAAEYAGYWRRDATAGAGAEALAGEAVAILEALRLAERVDGALVPRPAAARFAAAAAPAPPRAPNGPHAPPGPVQEEL